MAISKSKKVDIVKKLTERFNAAKAVVFTDYLGLKVSEMGELRDKLRAEKVELIVAKNTLIHRALKNSTLQGVSGEEQKGPVAVAVSNTDETSAARILHQYSKDHPAIKLREGIVDAERYDAGKIQFLAELPTKKELLAKAVGSIGAPLSGMINVLAGNLRGLVQVLKEISAK